MRFFQATLSGRVFDREWGMRLTVREREMMIYLFTAKPDVVLRAILQHCDGMLQC